MAKKKKNPNARYAIIGLFVALVACIATGFLGVMQGAVKTGLYTPANPDLFPRLIYAGIALIVLGLASYGILDPDSISRFFRGRQYRYGSNSLVLAIAMLGILFAVNYIVYTNPLGWNLQKDLTEDKSNTLAKETLQALATLPDKVTATAFVSQSMDPTSTTDLLQKFKTNAGGKFEYKVVDPDLHPAEARQAGITGDGKILLQMGNKKEIASSASETEIVRALIRLTNPQARAVYFLTGHGEADITKSDQTGMSTAKSTLESKNYTVNSLNLLATNKIPDDALAIIIAGPKKPLSSDEVNALNKYVQKGGSLVVLADPTIFTDFGDSPDPLADYLKSSWGITLDNDVIVDLTSPQPQALQAISASANQHAITQNLSNNYVVIMQRARSLSIEKVDKVTQTPLLLTSDQSWGETEFSNSDNQQIKYDEGKDIRGPLNMVVAADNSDTKGRVVVFGNSLFATDAGFDAYGNGNILINSIDWAAEQDNLINITPRDATQRSFNVPSQGQLIFIILLAIFIVPGIIIVSGIGAWISRRRKG